MFGLAEKIWTSPKHFGTCKRTRHKSIFLTLKNLFFIFPFRPNWLMRMAEVKAAPPLSAASENPPSNEVTQNSKPKSSGGGGGSGRRRGGDRGGGNGSSHGGNGSGHGQTGNSYDNDRADSVGRSTSRKKPELEHYKPGAFHGSRTPNNELNDQTPQQDETPQHSSGNKHSKVKMCTVIKKFITRNVLLGFNSLH